MMPKLEDPRHPLLTLYSLAVLSMLKLTAVEWDNLYTDLPYRYSSYSRARDLLFQNHKPVVKSFDVLIQPPPHPPNTPPPYTDCTSLDS